MIDMISTAVSVIVMLLFAFACYYEYRAYLLTHAYGEEWKLVFAGTIMLVLYGLHDVLEWSGILTGNVHDTVEIFLLTLALTFFMAFFVIVQGSWFNPLQTKDEKR